MNAKLIAAAALLALTSAAPAQVAKTDPILGMPCPDGTDPTLTGIPCTPVIHRNAIDEGRASTVLPQTPEIEVPNDPLGDSIGNSSPATGFNGGFGNPAIQLPQIR